MSSKIYQIHIFNATVVGNASLVIAESYYAVVCKKLIQVGKLAWPSLQIELEYRARFPESLYESLI